MGYGQYSSKQRPPDQSKPAEKPGKRIKHVFADEREIAHLWMAHSGDPAVQDNARNKGGNFYYHGDTIYSYGSHFPIARVVRNQAGERAVLLTTRGYSPTTSSHIGYVRQALDKSLPVWKVSDVYREGSQVVQDYARQIENLVKGLKPRALQRTKLAVFDSIAGLVNDANAYAVWAGIENRLTVPGSLEQVVGNLEAARVEAERLANEARAKREAKEKREAAAYRKNHAKDLEVWRATGSDIISTDPWEHLHLSAWPGDLLRVDHVAGEIETSRGAHVPLDQAEKAYRFVQAVRARGEAWETNGHTVKVGHYRIERIEADGTVKAGCHQIPYAEIARVAKDAGWDERAPAEEVATV